HQRLRGERLTRARLADDGERAAGGDVGVERLHHGAVVADDGEPGDLHAGHSATPTCERRCPIQSPTRLTAAATRMISTAGTTTAHGFSNMMARLSVSWRPQSAVPGGTPTPRNDSDENATSANATLSIALVSTSVDTFGRMCRNITRQRDSDSIRAASMYGRAVCSSTPARTMRMSDGEKSRISRATVTQ